MTFKSVFVTLASAGAIAGAAAQNGPQAYHIKNAVCQLSGNAVNAAVDMFVGLAVDTPHVVSCLQADGNTEDTETKTSDASGNLVLTDVAFADCASELKVTTEMDGVSTNVYQVDSFTAALDPEKDMHLVVADVEGTYEELTEEGCSGYVAGGGSTSSTTSTTTTSTSSSSDAGGSTSSTTSTTTTSTSSSTDSPAPGDPTVHIAGVISINNKGGCSASLEGDVVVTHDTILLVQSDEVAGRDMEITCHKGDEVSVTIPVVGAGASTYVNVNHVKLPRSFDVKNCKSVVAKFKASEGSHEICFSTVADTCANQFPPVPADADVAIVTHGDVVEDKWSYLSGEGCNEGDGATTEAPPSSAVSRSLIGAAAAAVLAAFA